MQSERYVPLEGELSALAEELFYDNSLQVTYIMYTALAAFPLFCPGICLVCLRLKSALLFPRPLVRYPGDTSC